MFFPLRNYQGWYDYFHMWLSNYFTKDIKYELSNHIFMTLMIRKKNLSL